MKTIFIGIDVSKRTLDVCVKMGSDERYVKLENNIPAIKTYFKQFTDCNQVYIAMKNTGHYNHNLYEALADFQYQVYVVDPKHIKRSIGLVRGKNDKVDAKRIAVFITKNHEDFEHWKPCSQTVDSLKILLSQRRSKVEAKRAIKQRLEDLKSVKQTSTVKKIIRLNNKEVKEIDAHIATIETLIREEIKQNKILDEQIKRIKTVPGIGDITAWTIACKTNGFTRLLDPRKLACFAGVVPFEQQSGTSIKSKPRVSKMADMHLKWVLQMAAMRAVRMNNDLQLYYLRKVEEGKNKMSVLNAVRNKLLHIAMALIKNQTYYQNRLLLS